MRVFRIAAVASFAALALGACEKSSKQDKLAYDACLAAAKKDPKLGAAAFVPFEQAKIAGSTGEEEIRVNIPYELGGNKAIFQCITQKQSDGSFKVVF